MDKPIRVVYLARGFGDYLIGFVNAMTEFVEVHMVLVRNDEWVGEHLNDKVKIFKSGSPKISDGRNLLTLLKIAGHIKGIKPDLIHVQSGIIWELGLFKLFPHIPFIVTVHDIIKHPRRGLLRFFPQSFLDYAARKASGVIVHGNSLLGFAKTYYGKDNGNENIASIDHGVIARYGTGRASVYPKTLGVLVFGSVDAWKGIEYLVACEPIVREKIPEVHFVVAGYSPDPAYYTNLLKPGQRIDMRLKKQNSEEVRNLFDWADVLVLPYVEASQSGVLQVGFAFGLPSVVTSVGGLPDVIRHEENGLVVPPKNPPALAEAIIRLLTDSGLREKIINNMTQDKNERFNWHNIALKTHAFYQDILGVRA